MNIKIFVNTASNNSERDLLKKFFVGVEQWVQNNLLSEEIQDHPNVIRSFDKIRKRPALSVELDYGDQYSACDVAVIMGSWKTREKGHHPVRTSVVNNARCFVCIETPLLSRQVFNANTYYRLGVNGFLSGDASWNACNKPSDRFNAMGLSWTDWRDRTELNAHSPIIVAMQLAGDASMRYNDINDWCVDTVKTIRHHTNRPIRIRFHPAVNDRNWTDYIDTFKNINFGEYKNVKFSNGRKVTLQEELSNAWCVVAYSSGISIDAIYAGVPVIACDAGNFAWNISSRFAEEINSPFLAPPDTVLQWLWDLAWCQWSADEMKSGQAWEHLLPAINTVLEQHK
jgi:hypothetical protein